MLLKQLVSEENEFVIAAFDVFDSDKDTEELVDTLRALLCKIKSFRTKKNVESLFPEKFLLGRNTNTDLNRNLSEMGSHFTSHMNSESNVASSTQTNLDQNMCKTIRDVLKK